jgi:hypothetical protein
VAHGELDGLLTRDWGTMRQSGDRGRWWQAQACGGSTL